MAESKEKKAMRKPAFKAPTEVGIGVTRITKRFRMPKSERELVEGVQSLKLFSGFRKLKRHNQMLFGLVVSAAIILYWRGLWELYDLVFAYSLPEHRVTSAFISIFLGLIILIGLDYAVRGLVRG
ncbi:MAG: hypothetical protein V1817_01995 [Candidatus Micrarchaeota archaeon]